MMKKQKKQKCRWGLFKIMGGNIPDGNFLSGNFPGENLPGVILIVGNFPSGSFLGESFPDTVQVKYLKSFQYRRLQ